MKNSIPKGVILSLVLVFSMTGTALAATYVLGYSSVDSSKKIEWGGSTSYTTEWNAGIATWNAKSKVKISADTIWTLEDVTVSDKYDKAVTWDGVWTYKGSCCRETLQLNSYYFSSYASAQKQHVTTHELGHALGLGHSTLGQVMYYLSSSVTALGSQDNSDYNYLYP